MAKVAERRQIYGFTVDIQFIFVPSDQCARNVSADMSARKHGFTHITHFYTENGSKLSAGERKKKMPKGGIK